MSEREESCVTTEQVMEVLQTCYDPCCKERAVSVVELGLILGVNMVVIELSVLGRQALRGRIKDLPDLQERVTAWQLRRHAHPVTIDWRFTTQDARIKLKRLYPSIEPSAPVEESVV